MLNLLQEAGDVCYRLTEKRVRGISPQFVECDEMWGFVGMKEHRKRALKREDAELGDAYTFVAIDAETKLIIA